MTTFDAHYSELLQEGKTEEFAKLCWCVECIRGYPSAHNPDLNAVDDTPHASLMIRALRYIHII
jgi:hypothetical protein